VRGKAGTISRVFPAAAFEDNVAEGLPQKPQHVYTVCFAARDLWGEAASQRDSVCVDLWEDYLEPA
jgi:nitrile hydratase